MPLVFGSDWPVAPEQSVFASRRTPVFTWGAHSFSAFHDFKFSRQSGMPQGLVFETRERQLAYLLFEVGAGGLLWLAPDVPVFI